MAFVEFDNVEYSYRSADRTVKAIDGVSFCVNEGEIVAILGHNGSGKSTLARLMNGLLVPDKGTVTVGGISTADEKTLFDVRKNVGVVFQNPDNQMVATIIEDDVAFGPENLGLPSAEIRARVDWALKSVGMYDRREGMPFRLSGGQKQRVAIAGVLAIKPRVMVLDESTSMLDPDGRKEVLAVVDKLHREENMAVVMITHFPEEALLADRIIVMNEGKIVLEGGKEIFDREEELKAVGLDVPFACRMAHALIRRGALARGGIYDMGELVKALCR